MSQDFVQAQAHEAAWLVARGAEEPVVLSSFVEAYAAKFGAAPWPATIERFQATLRTDLRALADAEDIERLTAEHDALGRFTGPGGGDAAKSAGASAGRNGARVGATTPAGASAREASAAARSATSDATGHPGHEAAARLHDAAAQAHRLGAATPGIDAQAKEAHDAAAVAHDFAAKGHEIVAAAQRDPSRPMGHEEKSMLAAIKNTPMHEATSYPHLPQRARAVADMLIARGYAKNVNNNVRITPAGEKALGKHD